MGKHEFLASYRAFNCANLGKITIFDDKMLFFHDLFRTNLLVKKDVKKVLIDLGFVASM
ncbi:MAG UNVERIFIED_CONTAM: hypothetical protein LVR29_29410 [Microcystis novacekii LVE1205-3]|jgi:hypothetical protein